MDYQNNSSYIFKEQRKHSLGATALSAVYTRWLRFNGSPYLGNENEISSRLHFPIDRVMQLPWSKWTCCNAALSAAETKHIPPGRNVIKSLEEELDSMYSLIKIIISKPREKI